MRHFLLIALAVLLTALAASGDAATRATTAKTAVTRQPAKERPEPPPVNILSIIPAQGEPDAVITVSGNGFGEEPAVFLGTNRVVPKTADPTVISFEIPQLSAGLYALYLRRNDGTTSKVYNFSVLPRKPSISSIVPDRITACGSNREIRIHGAYFRPDSRVAFDGALVPSAFQGSELITFTLPQVPGGLHHVQVRNLAEDTVSAPLALTIETRPEILSVRRGADLVNAYELVVEGRNFLQGSSLVVDGRRLSAGSGGGERDRVYYGGCDSITYLRFPYDTTPREMRLQVVNPTGEESNIYTMSTP